MRNLLTIFLFVLIAIDTSIASEPFELPIEQACQTTVDHDVGWIYHESIKTICVFGSISTALLYAFHDDYYIPRDVEWMVLNSRGGHLIGATQVAEEMIRRGVRTVIPEGAVCNSACVMLFASGLERHLHPKAKLGIHFVWSPVSEGQILVNNKMTRDRYLSFIEDVTGVDFYDPYLDWAQAEGFLTYDQRDLDQWERSRFIDQGDLYSRANLWFPDHQWLRSLGFIEN